MKSFFTTLVLGLLCILLGFEWSMIINGSKKDQQRQYEIGFEVGAMDQATYNCLAGEYMDSGFRQYLWHKEEPQTLEEMKIAYAKYVEVPYINEKDTTGLQEKIERAKQIKYERWLKQVERWRDSIRTAFLNDKNFK